MRLCGARFDVAASGQSHRPGLARIGADERLCSGSHRVAQVWSLSLWSHPDQPDGILYRARHDPERLSVAIYDRASQGLTTQALGPLIDMGDEIFAILDHYNFGLMGSRL